MFENTEKKFIWKNGKFENWNDSNVHILSHTLHYGTGVFEGVRAYKTEKGPAIFRLLEHTERLFNAASKLNIKIPFSKEEVNIIQCNIFNKNNLNEGYIRPNSIVIVSYSAGVISGNTVTFNVLFECLVCRPVEGMRFRAVVKNVTKAGIRAEINEVKSPVVVFIARDLHYKSAQFSKLKEGDDINVRVIGIRYELNDEYQIHLWFQIQYHYLN